MKDSSWLKKWMHWDDEVTNKYLPRWAQYLLGSIIALAGIWFLYWYATSQLSTGGQG